MAHRGVIHQVSLEKIGIHHSRTSVGLPFLPGETDAGDDPVGHRHSKRLGFFGNIPLGVISVIGPVWDGEKFHSGPPQKAEGACARFHDRFRRDPQIESRQAPPVSTQVFMVAGNKNGMAAAPQGLHPVSEFRSESLRVPEGVKGVTGEKKIIGISPQSRFLDFIENRKTVNPFTLGTGQVKVRAVKKFYHLSPPASCKNSGPASSPPGPQT